MLQKGARPELVAPCAVLLAATSRPEHLPLLRKLSSEPDYQVRVTALEALAVFGDARDLARLEAGLHDRSPWVALRAAYALKDLGGSDVLEKLAASDDPRSVLAHEVLGTSPA
jgi:HEAT repeat protein